MTDRELTGAEAQAALSEAIRRTLATKPGLAAADSLRDRLLAMADDWQRLAEHKEAKAAPDTLSPRAKDILLSEAYAYAHCAKRVREASALVPAETGREQACEALAFAWGAIADAVGLEDGLDGLAAEKVMGLIDRALVANSQQPMGRPSGDDDTAWYVAYLEDRLAKLKPALSSSPVQPEPDPLANLRAAKYLHPECGEFGCQYLKASSVQPDPVTPSSVARGAKEEHDALTRIGQPVADPPPQHASTDLAPLNHWAEDCEKWRGQPLTGRHAHWCADWDDLPIDETCPEWPCGCTFQLACEKPSAVLVALKEAIRLYETYGLLAQSWGCGQWINSARDAVRLVEKPQAAPARVQSPDGSQPTGSAAQSSSSPAPLPDAAPSASAETGTPWRAMDSAPKDRPIVVLSLRGNAYTVTHEDVWWFAKNVGRTFRTTDLRVWTDLPSSAASGEETP